MNTEIIKKCKLFENMTDEEILAVLQGLESITIPSGKPVISEHTSGDNLYVILKGSVEITKDIAENDDSMVAQLKIMEAGDFFGEMALMDDAPRSANVISRDNVELMVIPKERFTEISFSNPRVLFNLIRALSWRLRDTNQRFAEVTEKLIAQNRLMAIGLAASKIIHDIKTPLTVIILTAQLMENMHPENKDFTDSIVKQANVVDQMVREILDLAKGNTTPINPQKLDLSVFINDISDTFSKTLAGRDIEFIVENRVKQEVFFDENKIRRVVVNLIKNSGEAMKEKGYIRLDALMEDGNLMLIVSDSGKGLPDRVRENLFSPFISEGKTHGTGLGLAITQKLVQEHRGKIEYRPNQPSGTIFIITLPQEDIK